MEVLQLPVLVDNYIYLLLGSDGVNAVVDAASPEPVIRALESRGLKLDFIFNTHHHPDHVGANLALKRRYGCQIFGSARDAARIPGIDRRLQPEEEFFFDGEKVKVFAADGHTRGHIVYWIEKSGRLFCGDTIFSLGCGKLFEGSPEEMWRILDRLRALPPQTIVYTAHEYTLDNAAFALKAEPGNPELHARVAEAEVLRRGGQPTVPCLLGSENAANPFLRVESPELQRFVGLEGAEPVKVFAALRAAKDKFDRGEL